MSIKLTACHRNLGNCEICFAVETSNFQTFSEMFGQVYKLHVVYSCILQKKWQIFRRYLKKNTSMTSEIKLLIPIWWKWTVWHLDTFIPHATRVIVLIRCFVQQYAFVLFHYLDSSYICTRNGYSILIRTLVLSTSLPRHKFFNLLLGLLRYIYGIFTVYIWYSDSLLQFHNVRLDGIY